MIIIPAIDLIDGKCVRLSQGDYNLKKQYDARPSDMVRQFVDNGMTRIHVVDLDGAKASCPQNLSVLRELAAIPGAQIEWGGGIKTQDALEQVLSAGASYAVVGSTAASHPELFERWLQLYGAHRMVLGADVRHGRVAVNGWLDDVDLTIDDLVDRFSKYGLRQVICTDITRDGMLQGPATELYVRLQTKYPEVDFTVSGHENNDFVGTTIELVPKGCNKAVGIAAVCRIFDIPWESTVVFGDSNNDLSMFEYAATKVAMGNASKPIRELADYVTTDI